MFYDKQQFDWCSRLEDNWKNIREEIESVNLSFIQWHEDYLNVNGQWSVYPIYDYPHGLKVERYAEHVPYTVGLIGDIFPNHSSVGFSKLSSGGNIPFHYGFKG